MILFGKNIQSSNDTLTKVPLVNIYHALKNPKPETVAQIRQLRIIHNLDKKRYSVLKRQLPYLVCGIFNPPYRRSENFAFIEYFMIDIDKISEKEMSVSNLRNQIEKDSRVFMSFISPSEDGLKVLFKLSERCYDKGLFSLFYKVFAKQFARQYHIEQVIDSQTCDVTRACFVSYDPNTYYNENAETLQLNQYLPQDDPTAMMDLRFQILTEEKEKKKEETTQSGNGAEVPEKVDVDASVIANIKAILNPNSKIKEERPVWVPEQLNDIMDDLKAYITKTGVIITEVINISYGKKIRMRLNLRQAEVNLFYGKKGFSVVKSPRTGTNDELNDMMVALIQTFLLQ